MPERDAAGLAVEVEDDHLELVAHLHQLGGVADAPPRHVGDVEQAVDPAQIDEGAVVGDVLHDAGHGHPLLEDGQRVLALLLALLLQDHPAREHDVAPAAVELDDPGLDVLADHRVEVLHRPEVDLGAGQERLDADVDREAALDDLHDLPVDRRALLVGPRDDVPDLDLVGLLLGEDDEALGVFLRLEVDLDLHRRSPGVMPLRWNSSIGIVPSLLYPTSTRTSEPFRPTMVPLTTSPS